MDKITKVVIIPLLFILLVVVLVGGIIFVKNSKNNYETNKLQFEELVRLKEDIIYLFDISFEHQISINAIGEDCPPKKTLSERSWCDTECLKHQIK